MVDTSEPSSTTGINRDRSLAGKVVAAIVAGHDTEHDLPDLLRVEFTDGTFITLLPTRGGAVAYALRTGGGEDLNLGR